MQAQQNNVRNGRPAENIAGCIRKSVEVIVDSRFALLFWKSNRPRQDLMKVVQNAYSLLRSEAQSDSRSLNLQARWVSSLEQQTQKENDGEAVLLVLAWHSMTLSQRGVFLSSSKTFRGRSFGLCFKRRKIVLLAFSDKPLIAIEKLR